MFSHDVAAAILLSKTNPVDVEPYFLMQTLSFVPINLHRCWPREWKRSIQLVLQQNKSHFFPASCTVPWCNPESGTGKVFACDFGIRNSALGIRNPAKLDWNPEFKLHRQVLRESYRKFEQPVPPFKQHCLKLEGIIIPKKVKKSLLSLIRLNYLYKLFLLSTVGKTSLTFWCFDYLRQV